MEKIKLIYQNYIDILKKLPKETGKLIWLKPSEIKPTIITDFNLNNPVTEWIKRDNLYLKNETNLDKLYNSLKKGMYFPFFIGKGKPSTVNGRDGFEVGNDYYIEEGHHRLICLIEAEKRGEFNGKVLSVYHPYGFVYNNLNNYKPDIKNIITRKMKKIKIKYPIDAFFNNQTDNFKTDVINSTDKIEQIDKNFINISIENGIDVQSLLFKSAKYLQYLFHNYTNLTGKEWQPAKEINKQIFS